MAQREHAVATEAVDKLLPLTVSDNPPLSLGFHAIQAHEAKQLSLGRVDILFILSDCFIHIS